jgi:hypothetical protein
VRLISSAVLPLSNSLSIAANYVGLNLCFFIFYGFKCKAFVYFQNVLFSGSLQQKEAGQGEEVKITQVRTFKETVEKK